MIYVALCDFVDLQDNRYKYHKGDQFPHSGAEVTAERLEELAGYNNKSKKPLIEAVKAEEEPQQEEVQDVLEEVTQEEEPTEKPKPKRKTTTKKPKASD